ncbi:uncharacterized protein LOC124899988 [Capsicum annuum]|uniref:uncharacterized protein LOC124899988 n=1 Tax=Capsicum annuum TaxID=4072 RepID=UPI001FB0F034|nr:uncharacterized protein LOC124899988 [Capsicum annuum]
MKMATLWIWQGRMKKKMTTVWIRQGRMKKRVYLPKVLPKPLAVQWIKRIYLATVSPVQAGNEDSSTMDRQGIKKNRQPVQVAPPMADRHQSANANQNGERLSDRLSSYRPPSVVDDHRQGTRSHRNRNPPPPARRCCKGCKCQDASCKCSKFSLPTARVCIVFAPCIFSIFLNICIVYFSNYWSIVNFSNY